MIEYRLILERKYFRISDIVEELAKRFPTTPRGKLKEKVSNIVEKMIAYGQLEVLTEYDPPIFHNPKAKGGDLKSLLRKCPICGKDFFPKRGNQDKYCSGKCREKAKTRRRKADTRKRVRAYMHSADGKARKKGEKWSALDDLLLKRLLENGLTHREIAEKLGRTVYSVRWRAQKLGLAGGVNHGR